MSDTPSRLVKLIQYSPVTGVIEITTSDFPDWITTYPDRGRQLKRHTAPSFFSPFIEPEQLIPSITYPDKGRQLRRDIHAGPVSIKEDIAVVVVEEGSLTQFPFHGRELHRNVNVRPVNEIILIDENGHLTQIQKGRELPRHIHTGATFVPDIVVVIDEEGSLVQLAEGRKLRRDIHAGPSFPGIFIAEQLVYHTIYPDSINRIRLSPSQQQFTTHDPNFSIVPAAVASRASRHRRRNRSRTEV